MFDLDKRLSLFRDVLDRFCARALTKVSGEEIEMSANPPQLWNLNPVAFVSSAFCGSLSQFLMLEKICYAVVTIGTCFAQFLAASKEVSIFTDDRKMLFMISRTCLNKSRSGLLWTTHNVRHCLRPSAISSSITFPARAILAWICCPDGFLNALPRVVVYPLFGLFDREGMLWAFVSRDHCCCANDARITFR